MYNTDIRKNGWKGKAIDYKLLNIKKKKNK